MNSNSSHRFHWVWIIMGVCFLNVLISYSIRLGYAVVMPEMLDKLAFSRTQSGWIYNAYLLAYICLAPLAGYLTDRLGGRRVITFCCLILGLGTFCMGLVENFRTACLFYALTGIGAAGMWTPVITVIQRWFAPHLRGTALGIIGPSYGLGFAATGLLFPWIMGSYTWRYTWFTLGMAAMLMSLASAFLLRSDPKSAGYLAWGLNPATKDDPGSNPQAMFPPQNRDFPFFRNPKFWLIGFSYLAVSYCLYGITTFMIDYAKNELHLADAGLLATIHGIAQVIGVLTLLPLSDRWTRKKTILLTDFVIMLFFIAIIFFGRTWLSLAVLIGVMAVFYGAIWPLVGACGGDYFPKEIMGTVIGSWTLFYGLGAILTHWVTGLIRDASGSYQQAFLINAFVAGLAMLLIAFVRDEK